MKDSAGRKKSKDIQTAVPLQLTSHLTWLARRAIANEVRF